MEARRGRTAEGQRYLRSTAGSLTTTLRNTDGTYDRFSRDSTLRNLVLPRRQVRFVDNQVDTPSTFTGISVNVRLRRDSLTNLWSGSIVDLDGDVTIDLELDIGSIGWQSNTLTFIRSAASTASMGDAFNTGGSQYGKSVYIMADGATAEIPTTLAVSGSGDDRHAYWYIPNTTPWNAVRAVLDGIDNGDYFDLIIADPGGDPGNSTIYPLWTGYLEDIRYRPQKGNLDTVQIFAHGVLRGLTQKDVSSQMETDITTAAAARIVLEASGIPASDIGTLTGDTTMARWWAGNKQAFQALRELEETEGGILYEAADGRITFERTDARVIGTRRAAVASFSDDRTADSVDIITATYHDPVKEVANVVRVRVRTHSAGAEATLWSLPTSVELAAGESKRFIAEYPDGVDSWVTPLVASADYLAHENEDATGADTTTDITVTATERGAEIVLDVANGGSNATWLTTLGARGRSLAEGQAIVIERRDQPSIDIYEEQIYDSPALYLGSVSGGESYADYIFRLQAQPQRRFTITWNADANEALARTINISDRVILTARGETTSVFVERVEHRWDTKGAPPHTMTVLLSPAEGHSQIIILDEGPGLGVGVLAR